MSSHNRALASGLISTRKLTLFLFVFTFALSISVKIENILSKTDFVEKDEDMDYFTLQQITSEASGKGFNMDNKAKKGSNDNNPFYKGQEHEQEAMSLTELNEFLSSMGSDYDSDGDDEGYDFMGEL